MMDETELQPGRIKNDGKGQATHEQMPMIRPEHIPVFMVAFMLYIAETSGVLTIRQWKRRPPLPHKTNQNKTKKALASF